jgi:hypothetical protein
VLEISGKRAVVQVIPVIFRSLRELQELIIFILTVSLLDKPWRCLSLKKC